MQLFSAATLIVFASGRQQKGNQNQYVAVPARVLTCLPLVLCFNREDDDDPQRVVNLSSPCLLFFMPNTSFHSKKSFVTVQNVNPEAGFSYIGVYTRKPTTDRSVWMGLDHSNSPRMTISGNTVNHKATPIASTVTY